MAKLTAPQRRRHDAAMELLNSLERRPDGPLTLGERTQVLADFHPGSGRDIGRGAVFFTPEGLARDLMMEVSLPHRRTDSEPFRVVDVGAGIGRLGNALWTWASGSDYHPPEGIELTCIEHDQELCDIGRKVVPWAKWINADAFERDTWVDLGAFDVDHGYRFDHMISNPPYGISARRTDPWLKSGKAHFAVVELASMFASNATFVFPQGDLPFRYSGHRSYQAVEGSTAYQRWSEATRCQLRMNCGLDTSGYESEWVGASPRVEIALLERTDPAQGSLF